jgi:hypothetical protein
VTAGVPTALCSGVIDKYSVYDRPVPARSSADGIPAKLEQMSVHETRSTSVRHFPTARLPRAASSSSVGRVVVPPLPPLKLTLEAPGATMTVFS